MFSHGFLRLEKMRILHVWDQAGVASVLAKYQNRLGHDAEVIKREGFDKFGINKFYGTTIYHGSSSGFYVYALKRSREFDLVHVHSQVKIVPFLRKPTVLHFHGSDVRQVGLFGSVENWVAQKLADKVLVSTSDLLSKLPNVEWLPNPVDTDLFNPNAEKECVDENVIYYESMPCMYEYMPCYLRSKKVHIETKKWSLRKTSLEALACKTPVDWNGLIIDSPLPNQHKPEVVAAKTIEIYKEIFENES